MSIDAICFLSSLPWKDTGQEEPKPGEHILAELTGCKLGKYFVMEVRTGEALGHITRWCYFSEAFNIARTFGLSSPFLDANDTKP